MFILFCVLFVDSRNEKRKNIPFTQSMPNFQPERVDIQDTFFIYFAGVIYFMFVCYFFFIFMKKRVVHFFNKVHMVPNLIVDLKNCHIVDFICLHCKYLLDNEGCQWACFHRKTV